MSVFKAFFKIIKQNKFTFVMAIVLNLTINLAYVKTQTVDTATDFKATKRSIMLINHDQGEIGQNLEKYLADKFKLVSGTDDLKEQQDALFFEVVTLVVTIPENFTADFLANKNITLEKNSSPNSSTELLASNEIDEYLNNLKLYHSYFPEKNQQQLHQLLLENLNPKVSVHFKANEQAITQKNQAARSFSLLAYGLFASIISSVALVSLTFNRAEIRKRNQISPLSQAKHVKYFYASTGIFSILCWLFFVSLNFVIIQIPFDFSTVLLLINSLVFLVTIVSLSIMVAFFIKNHETISALSNILVLGTCFLSGVFVPQFILSSSVLKIAAFFPTYWFVTNNDLVATLQNYQFNNLKDYFFNLGILLLFSLVFLFITLISRRERSQNKVNWTEGK